MAKKTVTNDIEDKTGMYPVAEIFDTWESLPLDVRSDEELKDLRKAIENSIIWVEESKTWETMCKSVNPEQWKGY